MQNSQFKMLISVNALVVTLFAAPFLAHAGPTVAIKPAIITLDAKLTPASGSPADTCLVPAEAMSSIQASAFSDQYLDGPVSVPMCGNWAGSGNYFPASPLTGSANSVAASGRNGAIIIPVSYYGFSFPFPLSICFAAVPPRGYYVDSKVWLNSGRKTYIFDRFPNTPGPAPVTAFPNPNNQLVQEVPGVLQISLLCPEQGNPLRTLSAVHVSAVLTSSGQVQAEILGLAPSSTVLNNDLLFVRGNNTYDVNILYTSGLNDYLDRFTWSCTSPSIFVPENGPKKQVSCIGLPCANSPPCPDGSFSYFGHIIGYADFLGGIIETTGTRVVADGGLYGNYRYALLTPTLASGGGPFLLTNVMARSLSANGLGGEDYRVYANMSFPLGGQTESFTTPCTTAHVNPCQTTDIGDILTINPGYVKGDIFLKGLADVVNCPCLNILDLASSRMAASGPCTGAASVTFGATTPTPGPGSFHGSYCMAMGGLKPSGAPDQSVWNPNVLGLVFYDAGLGVNSRVNITDLLFANQTIVAGATIHNDQHYCFSSVEFQFINANPARPFSSPHISGSGTFGTSSGTTDFEGFPAYYSASVDASGTSVATASLNEGKVLVCLPAGTYRVTPSVSYPEGGATVPDITFTVGCMEKIIIPVFENPSNCCDNCVAPYPASYTVTVQPGFNFLANQLCHGTNDLLGTVLPSVPDGTVLYDWNKTSQNFDDPYTFYTGEGWLDASLNPATATLLPGEGFALYNPGAAFQLTFRGCVPSCPPPCSPTNGCCLVGRLGLGAATYTNLFTCPPECGTRVTIWNTEDQMYHDYDYVNGGWTPQVPVLAAGQAAFVCVQENTNCCLRVSNEQIGCVTNSPGKLNYSFDLKNSTGVPVKYLFLVPESDCYSFSPDIVTFIPPLQPSQTINVSVMINFRSDCPTNLCFFLAAHDTNFVQCCSIMHCTDRHAPVVLCASNKTVACGTAWTFDSPTASGALVTIANTVTNGPCPLRAIRVWRITDACSNFLQCTQIVTIVDTTAPVIHCPDNIVRYICGNSVKVYYKASAKDNCSPTVNLSYNPPSGTTFNAGSTTTVTVTATDGCGNTSSCTFTVKVVDQRIWQLFPAGFSDCFKSPNEAVVRSTCLNNAYSTANWKLFDDKTPNEFLGYSWQSLPSTIVDATLITSLLPNCNFGSDNDSIHLGLDVCVPAHWQYSRYIGAGNASPGLLSSVWCNQGGCGTSFSFGLTNLQPGNVSLLSLMNTTHQLDMLVEDDTAVDYAWLRVRYCPPPQIIGGLSTTLTNAVVAQGWNLWCLMPDPAVGVATNYSASLGLGGGSGASLNLGPASLAQSSNGSVRVQFRSEMPDGNSRSFGLTLVKTNSLLQIQPLALNTVGGSTLTLRRLGATVLVRSFGAGGLAADSWIVIDTLENLAFAQLDPLGFAFSGGSNVVLHLPAPMLLTGSFGIVEADSITLSMNAEQDWLSGVCPSYIDVIAAGVAEVNLSQVQIGATRIVDPADGQWDDLFAAISGNALAQMVGGQLTLSALDGGSATPMGLDLTFPWHSNEFRATIPASFGQFSPVASNASLSVVSIVEPTDGQHDDWFAIHFGYTGSEWNVTAQEQGLIDRVEVWKDGLMLAGTTNPVSVSVSELPQVYWPSITWFVDGDVCHRFPYSTTVTIRIGGMTYAGDELRVLTRGFGLPVQTLAGLRVETTGADALLLSSLSTGPISYKLEPPVIESGKIVIRANTLGAVIEAAPSPRGPWTTVPAQAGEVRVSVTNGPARFFRVRGN